MLNNAFDLKKKIKLIFKPKLTKLFRFTFSRLLRNLVGKFSAHEQYFLRVLQHHPLELTMKYLGVV